MIMLALLDTTSIAASMISTVLSDSRLDHEHTLTFYVSNCSQTQHLKLL